MKKSYVFIASAVVVVLVALLFIFKTSKQFDNKLATTLKNEANLDLIVNLGNFSSEKYQDSKLLSVAMQIAEKNNLLSERSGDNYIQYISENELHTLIYELTGISISAPIQIDDFYYLYDGENEYYYCRPASPINSTIKEIKSITENGSEYIIKCSTSYVQDLEETINENVKISLSYMPENSVIKYKVNYVELGK